MTTTAPASYVWDESVRTTHASRVNPGQTWETGTWIAQDGVVFTADANPYSVTVSALVPTVADAEALAATFPKSAKVKAGPTSSSDWDGYRGHVTLWAKLSADGINGGANEAGLARYRSFARNAARLGYEVRYAPKFANSLTDGEFAALTS